MSQFIESIRVENGEIHLLEEHQKRVHNVFSYFGRSNVILIDRTIKAMNFPEKGLFKLRIEYDLEGNTTVELLPYERHIITQFQLMINNNIDYRFKYKNRTTFLEMKTQAEAEEVIIVQNNNITDTSFSNIIFKRDDLWFVPKTYLLNGVQRQWLLKQNKIKEMDITLDNLLNFTHFKLINAMNDMETAITYDIQQIIRF